LDSSRPSPVSAPNTCTAASGSICSIDFHHLAAAVLWNVVCRVLQMLFERSDASIALFRSLHTRCPAAAAPCASTNTKTADTTCPGPHAHLPARALQPPHHAQLLAAQQQPHPALLLLLPRVHPAPPG
jgi:hypothetical protein